MKIKAIITRAKNWIIRNCTPFGRALKRRIRDYIPPQKLSRVPGQVLKPKGQSHEVNRPEEEKDNLIKPFINLYEFMRSYTPDQDLRKRYTYWL